MHVTCPGRALEVPTGHGYQAIENCVTCISGCPWSALFARPDDRDRLKRGGSRVVAILATGADDAAGSQSCVIYASRRACVVRLQSANMGVEADVQNCVQ